MTDELEVLPLYATKKPRSFWMRTRLLVFIAALWGLGFWYDASSAPAFGAPNPFARTLQSLWWLLALFGLEAVRQVHYLASERYGRWNYFWAQRVVGGVSAKAKVTAWQAYRFKRLSVYLIVIALAAIIAGKIKSVSPVQGLFDIPSMLESSLGTILYYCLLMLFVVGQFVAMFWFLGRGGIDIYYPDDIKTRFTHVWGQDAVLERIKESIVFLEDPESIESRGGYVPGGILLYGPPGTGKTLIAEAVAGETGKPFVFVDPGAFIQMFMGIGPLKVKNLFRKLRKLSTRHGGVVVFFDEADSLGSRGALSAGLGGVNKATSDCHGGTYLSEPTVSHLLQAGRVQDKGMVMGGGMNGGGGMGTLQALLSEMSGLSKPRGFMNRVVRKVLGIPPKAPPKYRILIMMATNMPNSLDEALLRPGRVDRIYKVGYPSRNGRIRTYQGYFDKVKHSLTSADIEKLATLTPYATGATIKDLVNESLILSLRRGHDVIEWADVLEAKRLKDLGLPEDVEYIEKERHAIAIHEACHAVTAYYVRKHLEIDLATIEKGGTYLGMVSSIKPEDRFTSWKSEFEADIMVSLASLAGERLFFDGDSSSGVSGDLESATKIAALMEGLWGMGKSIAAFEPQKDVKELTQGQNSRQVEKRLKELLDKTHDLLVDHRKEICAVAHALESHKTLSGEDVAAVIEGVNGRSVDGTVYDDPNFFDVYSSYHDRLRVAHAQRVSLTIDLPQPTSWLSSPSTMPAFG